MCLNWTGHIFSGVDFDQLLLACHVVHLDRLLGACVTYTYILSHTLYILSQYQASAKKFTLGEYR